MNDKASLIDKIKGIIPKGVPSWIGLITLIILAFSFGVMFSGNDVSPVDEVHLHDTDAPKEPSTWTCSMHPQIKLPKSGKCPICFMDLIPLESGSGDELNPRQIKISATAKELAQIQSTPVRRGFAEAEIRMVGKIAYDERNVNYITAWVPGRLDRLYADFTGINVRKGDHMVLLYSPELIASQEELLQAKIALSSLGNTRSSLLKETADETIKSAREKLKLFGLTEVQILEIENSGEALEQLTIYAPIGGVVVHKNAKEGMYVETGTQIYTIADLSKLWIHFEAYESDLPWLRYGQKVEFSSQSFPGESFEAIISFIDPTVDPNKRTVKIRAIVENESNQLKPDMFVSATVKSKLDIDGNVIDENLSGKWISPMHPEVVKSHPGSCDVCGMELVKAEELGYSTQELSDNEAPLLIPITSPMITGKRAVVYVELPDKEEPVFEGREVELGPRAGEFYIVKSGVEEGELIVTNGAFKIDSELQIQAKPSMMSPEGGAIPAVHDHAVAVTETGSHIQEKETKVFSITSEAREALTPLYNAYFKVQIALANDDLETATNGYKNLVTKIKAVDMSLFTGEAHMAWMDYSNKLESASVSGGDAGSIEASRKAFFSLSTSVIELQKSFGHAENKNYYLTYCPMAFDNSGAHWLQTDDIVNNSYYGDMMLRCGEIQDTLIPKSGIED